MIEDRVRFVFLLNSAILTHPPPFPPPFVRVSVIAVSQKKLIIFPTEGAASAQVVLAAARPAGEWHRAALRPSSAPPLPTSRGAADDKFSRFAKNMFSIKNARAPDARSSARLAPGATHFSSTNSVPDFYASGVCARARTGLSMFV